MDDTTVLGGSARAGGTFVEAGASCRATAAPFEVSVSFVVAMQRWHRAAALRPTGTAAKRSPSPPTPSGSLPW